MIIDGKYQSAIDTVLNKLKDFDEIDAVLLSGSITTGTIDEFSDIDLYLYLNRDLSVEKRTTFIQDISSYCEVNNQFWETEDCFIMKDSGIKVEIMYRSYSWIEEQLTRILENYQAGVGYSTCFCRNFLESKILLDNTHRFSSLQQRFTIDYPLELQKNIIEKNLPLLMEIQSSYFNQIALAVKRDYFISINHRVSAYLESYFDILFAINKLYHPGEKKLYKTVRKDCSHIPEKFEADIKELLQQNPSTILETIRSLTENIETIAKKILSLNLL